MKTVLTILLLSISIGLMAQTQPRRVVIKKQSVITKDSIAYLPDTLPIYFKEFIIKPDTIYEKWCKGFVVWNTWVSWNGKLISPIGGGLWRAINSTDAMEVKFPYTQPIDAKFLYSDKKTPVKNKVLAAIKR